MLRKVYLVPAVSLAACSLSPIGTRSGVAAAVMDGTAAAE